MAVAWTAIPDGDVDPESPITTSLMQALRDNPEGIAGAASGAPKIITAAITDLAVTTGKIAALAVTNAKINANAVTVGKIAANAVGTSELIALAVTPAELAADAVASQAIDNAESGE